jgi:exonuclease SbcC
MIPQRVKLKGFLCYQDEQEIAFDGASLWMLAGLNGSGKSTIFDAVTYALFGHHRGGSQHAHELINKDSDRLAVEFEFTLDGQAYLARRTLQRSPRGNITATQQISRRQSANGNGQGAWVPVEGTGRKTEFDAWVRENIGLNYETFTSSVLLLQGKAEKLLDSTARGRFEVLASIVDLERYKRLHERADRQRKDHERDLDLLKSRLEGLPEVTAEALAEVDQHLADIEAARHVAQGEVERLQAVEFQARQWAEFQGRLAVARQRWEQARQVLAAAADIERDLDRLRELREVLPRVQTVIEQRSELHQSELRTKDLAAQRQKLEAQLAQQDNALEQTRQKRASQQSLIAADERRHRDVAAQLLAATATVTRLKEFERQQGDLGRMQEELARLPADPAGAVRTVRDACDGLADLDRALPALARFHSQREGLRKARDQEAATAKAQQALRERGEQLAAEARAFEPQVAEAARAAQQAGDEATRARTLLDQARTHLRDLTEIEGAKVCRHCGQSLTPEHVREEKRRRAGEVAQAEQVWREAAAVQQAAAKREQELADRHAQMRQKLEEAREEFRDLKHQGEQAGKDVRRLEQECGQTYAELVEPFRIQVSVQPPADWLQTTYPTAQDLAGLRKQADGLKAARQRLREAEDVLQSWTKLKGQEATLQQGLARLQAELPDKPQEIRQNHVRLQTEAEALDKSLAARRAEVAQTQKHLDNLTRERDQTQQQLTANQGKLNTEEATRQHCRQALQRTFKELPDAWREPAERAGLAELHGWTRERADLEAKQTDERGRQLQQARLNVEVLEQEKATLEEQQAQFPEEARQEPSRIQALLRQAKQTLAGRDTELGQVRQHKAQLESFRKQRQELGEELLEAERELTRSKLLAELLGRDRLQLHLVRRAERQVVDHANAVLDRLSEGQLFLRLCGEAGGDGNTAKALEMEAQNRTTGEKPINVAFLSGSQKFRVAVSLALGIGQYASRQHRPIESVIIDEGFGCLDKEGRQAMIQELQKLRGHLRCILLVSHQEEFAEAFADGYRFELAGGATKVTRFQR